jgi:hypothetical protein
MPAFLEALTIRSFEDCLTQTSPGRFDRDGSICIAGFTIVAAFLWRKK